MDALFLKLLDEGEFTRAYRVLRIARMRRKAQRMRTSPTASRLSARQLMTRRAETDSTVKPS